MCGEGDDHSLVCMSVSLSASLPPSVSPPIHTVKHTKFETLLLQKMGSNLARLNLDWMIIQISRHFICGKTPFEAYQKVKKK